MEHSAPSVKGLVDSAPADLAPLVFAVTTVDVASGDSLTAGRVSAMGVLMSVTPTQALVWAAVTTQGASTVRGEPRAAVVGGGWASCLQIALMLSLQVHCWFSRGPTAAAWGPVPALSLPRRPWEPAVLCYFLPPGWIFPANRVSVSSRLHR